MLNIYFRNPARKRNSKQPPEYLAGGRVRFARVVPCRHTSGWRWVQVFNFEPFQRKFPAVSGEAA